jgi:hypothetical protein
MISTHCATDGSLPVCAQLARRHGMFLVDVELMFQKFWPAEEMLSDNHHLNMDANKQVLNVYLNLLRNRPRRARQLRRSLRMKL